MTENSEIEKKMPVSFFFRIQAIAIGQALIDADLLDPILNVTTPFRDDFTLYRPAEVYMNPDSRNKAQLSMKLKVLINTEIAQIY